jgi:ribose transport system permease protein
VVLGLTAPSGREAGAGSTLVGVPFLAVLFNAFNLEGALNSYWQWVLRGVILLLVVVVQRRLSGRG